MGVCCNKEDPNNCSLLNQNFNIPELEINQSNQSDVLGLHNGNSRNNEITKHSDVLSIPEDCTYIDELPIYNEQNLRK